MNAANFSVNDYVIYKGVGICRIAAIETKSFDDGATSADYFRLVPLGSGSSAYFVPVGSAGGRVRKPMTADEVNAAIDDSGNGEITLTHNAKERRSEIDSILKEGDHAKIISLIKSIYLHTESCRSSGRKILVSDENALRAAENMIYPEFSFALGIDECEVAGYIGSRLSNRAV